MNSVKAKEIALSIEALRAASNKIKITSELEDALEQLDSIVKLLAMSKPGPSAFQRLGLLLRQRLLPLYRIFPILGIRYSVAVLVAIHSEKMVTASKFQKPIDREPWEVVLSSLLSGILDFLEAYPSSETRAIVATTFYPTLRTVFFPQISPFSHQFTPELMCTLYQLLSETVTSQPANQKKLRSQTIFGGALICAIVSHTRDFLAIEALLELFAKILPPKQIKTGFDERVAFIKEVFSPSSFTCSSEIAAIFESVTTTDWEEIFLRIIGILSSADLSFPQPFEINNFQVHGSTMYPIERLYIDYRGLVANLDQDGQIETFRALYSSVQNIKILALSKLKVSVTMLLSSPPFVGPTAISPASGGKSSLSFDTYEKDRTRLLKSLTSRGLKNILVETGRKLSKAETTLELDFTSRGKELPVSTQEKVRDIARLWDINNSQIRSGQALPTSPLIAQLPVSVQLITAPISRRIDIPVVEDLNHNGSAQKATQQQAPSSYDSIFVSTEEELTDISDIEDDKPSRRQSSSSDRQRTRAGPKATIVDNFDDETEFPAPVRRRNKTRNQKTVVSDDEIDTANARAIQPLKTSSPRRRDLVTLDYDPTPTASRSASLLSTSTTTWNLFPAAAPRIESVKPGSVHTKATSNSRITRTRQSHKDNLGIHVSDLNEKSMVETASNTIDPATANGRRTRNTTKQNAKIPGEEKTVKTAGKKRRIAEVTDSEDADPDIIPSKKLRRGVGSEAADLARISRRPVPKRYGRKGRTSSPNPPSIQDFDFDELPVPSVAPIETKNPDYKPKSRVSAMKGKTGKAVTKKPAPGKPNIKKDTKTTESNIAARNKGQDLPGTTKTIPLDGEPVTPNVKTKPTRRSARVSNLPVESQARVSKSSPAKNNRNGQKDASTVLPAPSVKAKGITPPRKKATQSKKPQIAPWQDIDFLKNVATSDDIPTDGDVEVMQEVAFNKKTTPLKKTQTVSRSDTSPAKDVTTFSDQTTETAAAQTESEKGVTVEKPASEILEPPTPNACMNEENTMGDYCIPTKMGSIFLETVEPNEDDIVMIDLTGDSPVKPPRRVVPHPKSPSLKSSSKHRPQVQNPSPLKANQPRVSFASSALYRPYLVFDEYTDIEPSPNKISTPTRRKDRFLRSHKYDIGGDWGGYGDQTSKHRKLQDPMPQIVDIIGQITQVIVNNVSQRFDTVRKDLRDGQVDILCGTADDLKSMVSESIDHFHGLVSLEAEYATHHRKIIGGFEDLCKVNEELSRFLAGTLQAHNRTSLSRKFSNTFFRSPPPSIILNPKLVL